MVALQQVSTHVDSVFVRFGYLANRLLYIADLFTYLDLGPEESKEGEINRQRRRGPDCGHRSLLPLSTGGIPGNRRHLIHHPARRARGPSSVPTARARPTLVKSAVGLVPPPQEGQVALRRCRSESGGSERPVGPQSAAVFQDFTPRFALFSGGKHRLGTHRANGPIKKPLNTLRTKAGAAPIAEQLPEHYNTLLTKEFAGGTELSGGEWQRVAISRGVHAQRGPDRARRADRIARFPKPRPTYSGASSPCPASGPTIVVFPPLGLGSAMRSDLGAKKKDACSKTERTANCCPQEGEYAPLMGFAGAVVRRVGRYSVSYNSVAMWQQTKDFWRRRNLHKYCR